MSSIARIVVVGVMITAAMVAGTPVLGQDNKGVPYGPSEPPKRGMEESPFGGPPPPSQRGAKLKGARCATAAETCVLDPALPVGSACSCTSKTGAKTEGKAER